MRIGIIGDGFTGRAPARLAVQHRHDVMLSNLRDPATLANAMIRCKVGTPEEVAEFGEVILVAVPFANHKDIPSAPLSGKVVLDAGNYYPERDGPIEELNTHSKTVSELVAEQFSAAKVVKACNAILEDDIEKQARPSGAPDRRAIPIAGDVHDAKAMVAALLDQLGFDVVDAGPLSEGWRFEPGQPAYSGRLDSTALTQALEAAGPRRP
jgi:8-hydroxy-5-deazaflavin:NADPH oxidoreductase